MLIENYENPRVFLQDHSCAHYSFKQYLCTVFSICNCVPLLWISVSWSWSKALRRTVSRFLGFHIFGCSCFFESGYI